VIIVASGVCSNGTVDGFDQGKPDDTDHHGIVQQPVNGISIKKNIKPCYQTQHHPRQRQKPGNSGVPMPSFPGDNG